MFLKISWKIFEFGISRKQCLHFMSFIKKNRKRLWSFQTEWPMQHICRLEAGHVGGLLAPLNVRARLVERPWIVKQSHYIMWLICFINIRRMFQFPPVNRISADLKLYHWDRNITKEKYEVSTWFFSHRFTDANLNTVSSVIFFVFYFPRVT